MHTLARVLVLSALASVSAQAGSSSRLERRAPAAHEQQPPHRLFARQATDTEALASTGAIPASPTADLTAIGTTTTVEATEALPTTYAAGATPPVSGAPALPTSALNPAEYPALDVTPPVDSAEVQQWLSEIDMDNVPSIPVTGLNGCSNQTFNADNYENRGPDGYCWWTCGYCTRATDISFCPNQYDWGVSYDDGPSPDTPRLLNFLDANNVKSTFFIVGSRALSRPEMIQTEYMGGHQLSVHTWAHPPLTQMTNEEIVAELGWTKKVLKDITGVTPNTFRPPYGDIDDRVRYLALQMGLQPIIWTTADENQFDTRDWQIGGGVVDAPTVYSNFETFLESAVSNLSTGFIVLEHDLYQQSVTLAVDYILPRVLNAGELMLKPIVSCLGKDLAEAYIETSSNDTSLLQTTSTWTGASGTGFVDELAVAATDAGSSASPTSSSSEDSSSESGSSSSPSSSSNSDSNSTGAGAVVRVDAGMLLCATLAAFAGYRLVL